MPMTQAEFDKTIKDIQSQTNDVIDEYQTLLPLVRGCTSLINSIITANALAELLGVNPSSNLFTLGLIFGKHLAVQEALAGIQEGRGEK